jgi:hypothetical protein
MANVTVSCSDGGESPVVLLTRHTKCQAWWKMASHLDLLLKENVCMLCPYCAYFSVRVLSCTSNKISLASQILVSSNYSLISYHFVYSVTYMTCYQKSFMFSSLDILINWKMGVGVGLRCHNLFRSPDSCIIKLLLISYHFLIDMLPNMFLFFSLGILLHLKNPSGTPHAFLRRLHSFLQKHKIMVLDHLYHICVESFLL